jgi:hypothetical protein
MLPEQFEFSNTTAFEKMLATLKMLNDRGVPFVPGTDAGGPFLYHHEPELSSASE